jgi:hypothetical protein
LSGDRAGARAAIEAAMPGSSASMDYFFHRLPSLRSDQKAAAVHLGIFPEAGSQVASAYGGMRSDPVRPPSAVGAQEDRLSSIEQLLAQGRPSATQPPLAAAPQRTASVSRTLPARSGTIRSAGAAESPGTATTKRHWVQLASGKNLTALPGQFQRIKSRNRSRFDFEGLDGYFAEEPGRVRLLVGPFKDSQDAKTFAENLESVDIDAFSWTAPPGQVIRKLPSR